MRRKLTAKFLEKPPLPTPPTDRAIYWDDSLAGLGLMVTRMGHQSWIVQYRLRGKSHRITWKRQLYSYTAARAKALETLRQVELGENPAAKTAEDHTFGAIAEHYLRIEAKNLRSAALYRRVLERLVLPTFGNQPISSIRRSQIADMRDRIKEDNGEVMARLTFAIIRRVFSWYAAREDNFISPITKGMADTKPSERARSRILTDDELRAVWKAAGDLRASMVLW